MHISVLILKLAETIIIVIADDAEASLQEYAWIPLGPSGWSAFMA